MSSSFHLSDDFNLRQYLAYPHANGFTDGGECLVFGQVEAQRFSFWRRNLNSGQEDYLCEFPRDARGGQSVQWFDVAMNANVLITVVNNHIWWLDLSARAGSVRPELLYREPEGGILQDLATINASGTRLVFGREVNSCYQAVELDLSERSEAGNYVTRVLAEFPWFANHFHFSPHDERWIGFSHEGTASRITDRVWGLHAQYAPRGVCLFNNGELKLCVGHERWAFHDTSILAVAYGESPGQPRGLYEIVVENRCEHFASPFQSRARLVSEGNRDWHVDVSRCGRWAVVDTTGPHDAPGCGWQNAGDVSDVLVVNLATGQREFVARSRQHAKHPCHPHPVFSPDGATIFYNEAAPDGKGHRIVSSDNPWLTPAHGVTCPRNLAILHA